MANALEQGLTVHQALHGYADGHRMLGCSKQLKAHDQKTMLIMSDVSGSGASIDPRGYLTGYPLADSGVYALGRTWAATEMERPGCVWTHTILIDFADLAGLQSMGFLASAFTRPGSSPNTHVYSVPFTVPSIKSEQATIALDLDALARILFCLYGQPRAKVLSSMPKDADGLALAIWAQQWPRLRRSFRFCTSSFADRSTESASFDLQFTSLVDRSFRSRFADVLDADRTAVPSSYWLTDAVRDVVDNRGDLRNFMREAGGDIAGGREMFAPLCTLHFMIPTFANSPSSIGEAITVIEKAFDTASAGSLRSILLSAIVRHPEQIESVSAGFLVKYFDLLNLNSIRSNSIALGKALWNIFPRQLLESSSTGTAFGIFAKNTIELLDTQTLIDTALEDHTLFPSLMALRPDLLSVPQIWTIREEAWLRDAVRNLAEENQEFIQYMMQADRSDLAYEAVERFGKFRILEALAVAAKKNDGDISRLNTWLELCIGDRNAVADLLAGAQSLSLMLLTAIAKRTSPDFVPNDVGIDPWVTAISHMSHSADERSHQYLAGYLLARAFGYRSKSQIELIEFSFDEVYFAAFNSRLSEDVWQLLERALPRSWWPDWDRCRRLRDAITDLFVNRNLAPSGFSKITLDNSLFADLASLAADNSRGRKFLRKALQFLRETGGGEARVRMIEKEL